ncbi:MAG: efflux RND transporter periplasmic adaptor subunit [Treponema sp.]|nr:efflux RND transporter periplasmic adaptor subunit [Treponema sp.]
MKEYDNDYEEKPASKKGLIISVAIFVAAIVILIIAFIPKKKASSGMPGAPAAPSSAPAATAPAPVMKRNAVAVKVVTANPVDMQAYVTTNGEVETQTSIDVFPSIGGKIVQMNVSLGSTVKKGDVIAYVDPSEPGSYYSNSPIVAPISGSILTTPLKTGQKVNVSSVITRIGDINNLQITAKVPERYVADLKIGQKAEIRLEAYPDDIFSAKVVKISPVVDPSTRTKEIILNFTKADSKINAGMFARVKLYTTVYSNVISINQDSIVNNNDDYFLYVVKEDNTVERRKVTLGANIDGYYQILTGIEDGEIVVTEGMLTLYEGAEVNIIQ